MRILHIITTVGTGGAERMLLNLITGGVRYGFHHGVIGLRRDGALAGLLSEAGADLWNCGLANGERSLRAGLMIRKIIKSFAPEVVHGHMYHGNMAACLARRFWRSNGPPVIWAIHHSIDDVNNEKPMTRTLIRAGAYLSGWPDRVIYVSRVSRRQHEALGYKGHRATVIPNGFDCSRFQPRGGAREELRSALGLHPDAVVLAKVAIVRPMKDHANLMAACALLKRRGVPFHLLLIGLGTTEQNLELMRLIESADVRDRIILMGERHDVPCLMAGLDGLVVSSAWGEAFPIVLGEAMATGVPCVTTDVGDSALIVGDTGIVVPPRDPEALAEGMARLVSMGVEGRRGFGTRARSRIVEHFSLDHVISRYYDVYSELGELSRGHRRSHPRPPARTRIADGDGLTRERRKAAGREWR